MSILRTEEFTLSSDGTQIQIIKKSVLGDEQEAFSVVIFPGMLDSALKMESRILLKKYSTIYFSLRGRGKSGNAISDYSFSSQLRDIESVLSMQKSEKIFLITYSIGTVFALSLSEKFLSRICGIIIVDGSLEYFKFSDKWLEGAERNSIVDPIQLNRIAIDSSKISVINQLSTVKFPVSCFVPEFESLMKTMGYDEILKKQLPSSKIKMIPNSNHETICEKVAFDIFVSKMCGLYC